jgi:hypothetical protein
MNNATEYPAVVRMGVMMANAWLRSFVSNSYYYIYSGDTEKLTFRFDFDFDFISNKKSKLCIKKSKRCIMKSK